MRLLGREPSQHPLQRPLVAASHSYTRRTTKAADASDMERAHVLIRLQSQQQQSQSSDDAPFPRKADGITRTSATTVRLEHSDMSPGVASITFERVYDQQHSSAVIFEQSLAPAVAKCAQGFATTLVLTGAPRSGKSFTCHGDKQQKVTGMITLALRHVFKELERMQGKFLVLSFSFTIRSCGSDDAYCAWCLEMIETEPDFEFQVLLSCFHVVEDQLVDLLQSPPAPVLASLFLNTDEVLLQRSILVGTSVEAVHSYSQAYATSIQTTGGSSDFVFMVHVETKKPNEQVQRGRFACIDIYGSSILEPTRWQDTAQASPENDVVASPGKPFFSDTHFPVASTLSNWFGGFVGNESATYMLVTIQKQAQFQQQAIQSLLYACKAKDIKSTSSITYLSSFTSLKAIQQQKDTSELAVNAVDGDQERDTSCSNQTEAHEAMPPDSPVSLTASNSASEFQSERQNIMSERLRKAYESVKSSSTVVDPLNSILVPKKSQVEVESGRGKHDRFEGLFATKANFLHAKADAILKNQANELQALSLLDKLELIHAKYQETEKLLAQETSIKEKCVDRISKLSQTMSFQVVEHEKQMQQILQEKEQVQTQLAEMERKFEDVSKEIEQLQQQVQLMKASRGEMQAPSAVGTPLISDSSERVLLQQFSSRLESAMEEAKGVVDFKDGVIRELERRLEESAQSSARSSKELARQKLSHEQEKVDLLSEIKDLKTVVRQYEETAASEAARVERESSEFVITIAHLKSEIKFLGSKLDVQEHEHSQALAQTAQDHSSCTGFSEAEKKQRLEELLTKKIRECIASQAASAANRRAAELLQTRVEEVAYKLERKKRKMEKKMKALLSDRKVHKTASSRHALDLVHQIEDSKVKEEQMEKEIADLRNAIRETESNEATLRSEIEQLQRTNGKLERRCQDLQQKLGALETENHEKTDQYHNAESKFEQRIYEMEQSLARRLLEREAQLAAEHERKLKKMMDRHSAELLQRDVHDEYVPRSASSLSTLSSTTSDFEMYPQQKSIDQLDALISSKEKQYARSRESTPSSDRKKPPSARQEQKLAELKKKLNELTQALAVANEQETLAKEQAQRVIDAHQESLSQRDHLLEEMNRLKKENWTLSLALQVTERQRQ